MDDLTIRKLLKEAYEYAMENATDPSTQNGAVIVAPDGRPISYGANHLPYGVKDLPERWERPGKYQFVEHAERNAIYAAARDGMATGGQIMVCPWFACADCARGIIQAGIKTVIGHQSPNDWTPEHWKESIAVAWRMLEEAGVETRWYVGKIGEANEIAIRFNGQIAHP